MIYRGSADDVNQPLGLRINSFVFPFIYKSGYEKAEPMQQAAFAYDFVRFQDSKGIGRPEKETVTEAEVAARHKTLRYRAYENFAVAWWYANSPTFRALSEEQRKRWAFESLLDGILIYHCYLSDNHIGKGGEVSDHLAVFETQLGNAHIKHDETYPIGG
jgi:hypothetical protein